MTTTLKFQHTRQSFRLFILLFILVLYTCICALIFNSLEEDNDRMQYDFYQGLKKDYKQKYNMSDEDFLQFVTDASVLFKRGYVGSYKNYWNFYHSFWFTTTVITTMGFGQVTPLTFGGRLFCIFCALLGIPLNLVVLKTVSERITRYIYNTIKHIEKKYRRRKLPSHVGIKAAVVSFMIMVAVVLVGGASDMIFDGWTFFDGVYFNFIAYSTIGFGDLFPRVEQASKLNKLGFGESGKRLFAAFVMLTFTIVGLSMTSSVICSILNAIDEMSNVPATWRTTSTDSSQECDSVKLKSIKKEANGGQKQEFKQDVNKKTSENLSDHQSGTEHETKSFC